jgi:8-oxo-dGTP pyrophosphatase MutT (NUDIX family)
MTKVVTCLLIDKNDNILILKRSDKVRTYKGYWSGISGYIEEDEKPIDTAFKEIRQETGLNDKNIKLIKTVNPIEFTDIYEEEKYHWKVYPFLFRVTKESKIQIDWENIRYRWIKPSDIDKFETVPHLKEVVVKLFK